MRHDRQSRIRQIEDPQLNRKILFVLQLMQHFSAKHEILEIY